VIILGEPFSEPRLLAPAYDYEQATLLRDEPELERWRPSPPRHRKVAPRGNLIPEAGQAGRVAARLGVRTGS
jgi:hypothetical protein